MLRSKCDSTHNITELSIFSASASGFLLITTIPLNGLMLLCLVREVMSNKVKYKMFFYKIIINIAIADLLKGVFADTSALVWHVKESCGIGESYKDIDVPFVHVSLFITDGVALVSMAILSTERILALLSPMFYVTKFTQILILMASWPLSVFILLPYTTVGFLVELIIFFACTNSIAVISLVLLTAIYRTKFKAPYSRSRNSSSVTTSITDLSSITNDTVMSLEITEDSSATDNNPQKKGKTSKRSKRRAISTDSNASSSAAEDSTKISDVFSDSSLKRHKKELCKADPIIIKELERVSSDTSNNNTEQNKRKRNRSTSLSNIAALANPFQRSSSSTASMRAKQGKRERKVTLAFLKMLLVFIFTYLPTLVMVIVLNLGKTKCDTIHVLRDLSVLSILSSSLFRAINFLATLRHVRESTKKMLTPRLARKSKMRDAK